MKPIPPDLSTGVAYGYMPVTHINAGLEAARVLRGEPIFKVNRKPRGGAASAPSVGGSDMEPVFVYDDIVGGTASPDGLITESEDVRYLPRIADGAGWRANLEAEFGVAKVWSLASMALNASCCGGDTNDVPTGPRITPPLGPGGINRVRSGETLTVSGTGAVPGEELTLTVIAIDPTTGATSGSAIDIEVTNNGDGSWDGAATAISTLTRGVCRVMVTNGSTYHALLILNSLDEWDSGRSNGTGLVYWTSPPDAPDLHVDSDTGGDPADNITDDTEPEFTLRFGGTEVLYPNGDVEALLCLTDQSDGSVTIVGGSLSDFDVTSVIQRAATTLAIGTYEVQLVLRLAFENTDYPYDEWWSPPSLSLRVEIVEDADVVPPPARVVRLGWRTTRDGVNYVTIDKCIAYNATEEEIAKMDEEA